MNKLLWRWLKNKPQTKTEHYTTNNEEEEKKSTTTFKQTNFKESLIIENGEEK